MGGLDLEGGWLEQPRWWPDTQWLGLTPQKRSAAQSRQARPRALRRHRSRGGGQFSTMLHNSRKKSVSAVTVALALVTWSGGV